MNQLSDWRARVLLEFRSINTDSLKQVDRIVWGHTDARCWLLHDGDTGNAMVLVVPKEPLHREYFIRSKLVDDLKREGYGEYGRIAHLKIDKVLGVFIKRPAVVMVTYSDDAQAYFDNIRGKQMDAVPLAQLDNQ